MGKKITAIIFILISVFSCLFMLACNNNEDEANHTHSYEWNHDSAYHWKECECAAIDEATRTIHNFKYVSSEEYHWQQCECGYSTAKTEHSYDRKGICVCGSRTDAEIPYTMEEIAGVYYLWDYSGRDGGYRLDKDETIEIFADGTIRDVWGNVRTCELKGYTIQINDEYEQDVWGIRDNIICFTYEVWYNYEYQAYLCKEGVNPYKEYGDLYYSVGFDGNYCIIGAKNAEVTSITIPLTISKVDVTSVGYCAFRHCNNLTEVIIPEGITTIGQSAFSCCDGLTNIVIPDSVTSIGRDAFFLCSSLESIIIGNGVTDIGYDAFGECDNLKRVSIGSCEADISYSLFKNSGNLESIEASEDNKRYYVDNNCLIERETKTLVLGCKSSIIPSDVTGIGEYAFAYSNIESLAIPNSVTGVGKWAFAYSNIESLTIPDSVMSVGGYAFYHCENLQYSKYDSGYYLGNDLNPYLLLVQAKDTEITDCIVHDDTRIICADSFARCCDLESVTIGSGVISIGDSAFNYCESLKSITIPDSVIYLGRDLFWWCSSLESIYIGSGVTNLGFSSIEHFINLKSIIVSENNKAYYSINNCLIERETDTLILGCQTSIIPDGVTCIGDSAFFNCENLERIVIPDSVTVIEGNAFHACSGLKSVIIGKGVTTIGYNAFASCNSLKSIIIPENVTTLESSAFGLSGLESVEIRGNITNIEKKTFYRCWSLKSIIIPDSVTSIEDKAFDDCKSLESIYYKGTVMQWNAIITIDYYLNKATVYYYSESEPQYAGNYWHWDDDGVKPVVWEKINLNSYI